MPKIYYKHLLEIACFSVESCTIAQNAGADRIEFCANYSLGGITPTREDILKLRELIHIPLHVIIRPRGGNFVYSNEEINTMKTDILFCKENGINGVVFGILDSENNIDIKLNNELVELAKPMSITFHRAIDMCDDIEKAFTNIIALGFDNVLTSGGKQQAEDGIETIKNCQEKFGEKITIIPGGGIRSNNIERLAKETYCNEFHSAALNNQTQIINSDEINLLKQKLN